MNTRTILQKLKSTKLWCAIAGIATGIYIVLGGDSNNIQVVAGAITSLVSVVAYIVTEGKIDSSAIGSTIDKIQNATEIIKEDSETKSETN